MTDHKSIAIVPTTVAEVEHLAARFSKSSLLPDALRGKEADVFLSIMAGQELGLPPMAALRSIHVVKGRPILSADSMVGIVLGSGLAEYFSCVEETNTSATYETKRRHSPHSQRCTWTIEDAKRANLTGDNWIRYPRSMLKARAKAMLARDVYPDVLAGCYDEDESREFGGRETVLDVRQVSVVATAAPTAPPAPKRLEAPSAADKPTEVSAEQVDLWIDSIRETTTAAELRDLAKKFNGAELSQGQRQALLDAYKAHADLIRSATNQPVLVVAPQEESP